MRYKITCIYIFVALCFNSTKLRISGIDQDAIMISISAKVSYVSVRNILIINYKFLYFVLVRFKVYYRIKLDVYSLVYYTITFLLHSISYMNIKCPGNESVAISVYHRPDLIITQW
jgi:hypothetical protein